MSVFLFPLYHFYSKIGKLTLARLLMAHDAIMPDMASDSHKFNSEEVLQLYRDLMELDPMHSQYYKEAQSLVLLQQVHSFFSSVLFVPEIVEGGVAWVYNFFCN